MKKNLRNKYILVILVTSITVIVFSSIGYKIFNGSTTEYKQYDIETTTKFNYLVENGNSACYGINIIALLPDDGRVMGSCCGPMFLHTYSEQLEALKKYSNIDKIPKDPYDISVKQAKELIAYFKTIQLSPEQQQIYEEAKELSYEGGPCCCGDDFSDFSCWRWKVYGGLAKYLITEYNFNAQQIADIWDISDGCGGDHHIEAHT